MGTTGQHVAEPDSTDAARGPISAWTFPRSGASAAASAGDLIICRANDHRLEAGKPGRTLANGDVLRIEAITRCGIMVRRPLDPNPSTGQRRFTAQAFRYTGYPSADLAYAITGHSAQGATVHTGIALVTGSEGQAVAVPRLDLRHRRQPRIRVHRPHGTGVVQRLDRGVTAPGTSRADAVFAGHPGEGHRGTRQCR